MVIISNRVMDLIKMVVNKPLNFASIAFIINIAFAIDESNFDLN